MRMGETVALRGQQWSSPSLSRLCQLTDFFVFSGWLSPSTKRVCTCIAPFALRTNHKTHAENEVVLRSGDHIVLVRGFLHARTFDAALEQATLVLNGFDLVA